MKQTALLTKENQMTLFLLAKVNDDILTNGLTADNLQDLEELQFDLLQIIQKFAKIGRKFTFKICCEPPLFKIDILQPCQQLQEQKLYIYSSRFLLELNSNITKSENLLLQTILQVLISFICGHNIFISSS